MARRIDTASGRVQPLAELVDLDELRKLMGRASELSDTPLVSVIIPVWNGSHFLGEAIASIRAQDYPAHEILVIDDGSTDDTAGVAARLGADIRYFAFPHRGLVETRIAGLDAARGEKIAFLDVDDVWAPGKTRQQVVLLQENPDILFVNGYTQLQRLVSTNESPMRFEDWGAPLLAHSFGSALFRRSLLEHLGLESAHQQSPDLDWFLRARDRQVPMLNHTDVVQYYRRHANNMTNDREQSKRALLLLLKDTLARRNQPSA